jgi:hypothetical protein
MLLLVACFSEQLSDTIFIAEWKCMGFEDFYFSCYASIPSKNCRKV